MNHSVLSMSCTPPQYSSALAVGHIAVTAAYWFHILWHINVPSCPCLLSPLSSLAVMQLASVRSFDRIPLSIANTLLTSSADLLSKALWHLSHKAESPSEHPPTLSQSCVITSDIHRNSMPVLTCQRKCFFTIFLESPSVLSLVRPVRGKYRNRYSQGVFVVSASKSRRFFSVCSIPPQ